MFQAEVRLRLGGDRRHSMANDIIGGPEPLLVRDHLFYISPLNDVELAALDSWVSWRIEKPTEATSENGLQELGGTLAGIRQLIFQSVRRTSQETLKDLSFIDDDDVADGKLYEFWFDLNFSAILDFVAKDSVAKRATKADRSSQNTKNSIYTYLSRAYQWTPQQISQLTPMQQLVYLSELNKQVSTAHHSTINDYVLWQMRHNE